MFASTRFALIMAALAVCPAWGQISASQIPSATSALNVQLRDASNTEINHSFPHQETSMIRGTTSVTEMEHPLEGKSLDSLIKAEKLLANGESRKDKGETEKGVALLQKLTTDRAAAPHAFGMLGATYLKAGDLKAAISALDAAVAMSPSVAAYHSNLALALGGDQRYEEALKEVRKALQLDPGHSKYRFVAGQILLALGRKEEAEFHLTKAAADFSGARELLAKYFGK